MAAIYTTTFAGETASRRSARHLTQEYHFAIWAKRSSGWSCEAYSSRADLAAKRASELRQFALDVAVVPVTCELKTVKPKPDTSFPGAPFEVGGIVFGVDPQWSHARLGTYLGWTVRLFCTGRVFRASK